MFTKSFPPLLLLLLLAPMAGKAQSARVVTRVVTDTVPAWKTWRSNGLAMNYPGKWNLKEPVQGDTIVVFSWVPAGQPADAPEVQVVVLDAKDLPVTPPATGVASMDIHTSDKGNLRTVRDMNRDGVVVRIMEEMVSGEGRPYRLTYTAPKEMYGEYLYMAEAMMNSFAASGQR